MNAFSNLANMYLRNVYFKLYYDPFRAAITVFRL